MGSDLNEIKETIKQLKLERDILKDGGYGRSVRTPWKEERLFRDSVTCLNVGETVKRHPCDDCVLWEWVPHESKDADIPCHFIPLNETGDTIDALENQGDREKLEKALLDWLDSTIKRLEGELAKREAAGV